MINNNNLTNNLYIIGFDRKPSELYNLIIFTIIISDYVII